MLFHSGTTWKPQPSNACCFGGPFLVAMLQRWHSYNQDQLWSKRGYDIGLQSMRKWSVGESFCKTKPLVETYGVSSEIRKRTYVGMLRNMTLGGFPEWERDDFRGGWCLKDAFKTLQTVTTIKQTYMKYSQVYLLSRSKINTPKSKYMAI